VSCDDVDLILAVGAVSGGWEPAELEQVRVHTAACTRCATAAVEYTAAADALVLAVEPAEPAAGLRTRIMAEVYGSISAATRQPQPPSGMGTWLARLWRGVPSGRGFTVGGLVAAAAAVALLVWAAGPGRQSGTGSVSASVQGMLADRSVHGSFTYYAPTRTGVLTVEGLAAPGAKVYEVWLVRPSNGGAPSPVGFLTRQPDGTWSAAIHRSLDGYASVAATVEPPGGSSTPTGQMVLLGSLPSA
jgi:anti-sigma-K factor RskA